MSTVITNPNPKARFQESKDNVSKHRDLIQCREFERAADFALLQYAAQLAKDSEGNLNQCAASHLRFVGAQEFLAVFRNLSESASLPYRRTESPNLDHTA